MLTELDNAMLPGSDRENKEDSKIELGRFGLGLKSASLSQCREFTVARKKFGKIRAMSFDMDVIESENKLMLKQVNFEGIDSLPHIDDLKEYDTGTLVIWTKFDKISDSAKSFKDSFRSAVADSKKHVELVFHRFYDSVSLYYNDKRIEKRDPFLLGSVGRQQTGRTSSIDYEGSAITVIPYTLPFANTLTTEGKALLGNPKSIFDEQGFYLYRNERLISITELHGSNMPAADLLVYSFPCQDLSTGGLGKGMKKGSGTRSGLLWEVERILNELKALNRLPEYLLMENVKTIKADTNIDDLNQWLDFLSSIGYSNEKCLILNALDFGIPQDRERAFIISHLGSPLNIKDKILAQRKPRIFNIHDFILTDYSTPEYKAEADVAQLNKTPSREQMWDGDKFDHFLRDDDFRVFRINTA